MPTPEQIVSTINLIEEVAHKWDMADSYYVGGYPRAMAMGLPLGDVHDLDIASGSPAEVQELAGFVAEASKAQDFHVLHRTGTITMTVNGVEVDFQGSASHDHVAPYVRIWGVPETKIALNLFDRDFTMNALAIKIGTDEILDITRRAIPDIHEKRISAILPPDEVVDRNPLMITRAIRFACKYDFKIERTLWKAMKRHKDNLYKRLSSERLAIEAYVLSKYPKAKDLIEELGIDYLEAPAMVQQGQEAVEE